ncbi:hypothetical protein [Compostimonas suwonensis]|uniref:Uncharacterized protein n=1 Tax=Compostimonas suwonensis TaxID=1048394 RepID=A0A2M9BCA9_9MICO|nr:hypothetical protein [Compostimonas suwonensis]PJJ55571.1 hypothetical protein CLV54_2918 [Compostimonas suwonensis]
MADDVLPAVARRLGSPNAKPRIIQVYKAGTGWTASDAGLRLTATSARGLRAEGITMVRVSWRLRSKEFSLRELVPSPD